MAKISVAEIAEQLGLTGEITDVVVALPYKCYYTQKEADGWYLYTTSPTYEKTGEPYTGELFGGRQSAYYKRFHNILITVGGVEQTVVMKFIATPVQLNDPGAIDGVTVGDSLYNFASGMPLSTVYINYDLLETPTSWKLLTNDPGFVFRSGDIIYNTLQSHLDEKCGDDQAIAVYDPTVPGATKLLPFQDNYFAGPLFSYTFENAAILSDGTPANVRITYSDAHITVDDRTSSEDGFRHFITLAYGKYIELNTGDFATGSYIDTELFNYKYGMYKSKSAAVRLTATIQIVDDGGNPIDGSFIVGVDGVNNQRIGSQVSRPLYNGYEYNFWSEALQVNGGTLSDIYVRPNNEEIEPDNYGTGVLEHYRQWFYPYVTRNDGGIRFTASGWGVPVGGELVIEGGNNGTYSAGFVTTADARNGIRLESYIVGNAAQNSTTYLLHGYPIWHRIRSGSTRGGTIQTTTEGNVGGALSDGGTVLAPGTYVVPDGKTVVYTMTPEYGYVLDSVTVKSDSLSYYGGDDVTASVTPVYGGDGHIMYYTYTFPENMQNKAIYVKWKKIVPPDVPIPDPTPVPGDLNGDDHFAYIIGYPDGMVHPEANITRAEVATIFFRLLKDEVRDANWAETNSFSDVSAGQWFNNAVSTMANMGIVNGYPDGTFKPNENITRAEFAAIAARFDKNASSTGANFSDISGHWAEIDIAKAAANGWVNGYPDGTFKPDKKITRAEAMALVNRVLDRDPAHPDDLLENMIKWPDNMDTRKWYYLDVQEATNSHTYERTTKVTEKWVMLEQPRDWKELER